MIGQERLRIWDVEFPTCHGTTGVRFLGPPSTSPSASIHCELSEKAGTKPTGEFNMAKNGGQWHKTT